MPKPLDGVRVADFSQIVQGALATQRLADMGADVIKIEPPQGDGYRHWSSGGMFIDDEVSPWYLSANRNKRSVVVDLKSEEGRDVAIDIVADADALVQNFRPGVMDRLGFGYDDVTEVNPSIVYVSGFGFGSDGPYKDRPAVDLVAQSLSGVTWGNGRRDDPPTPVFPSFADYHSASLLAMHTVMALFYKERTGEGQKVEANLLDAAIDFQIGEVLTELNMDYDFERSAEGIAYPHLQAPYGIYETDDDYVAIAVTAEDMNLFVDMYDAPELAEYDSQKKLFEYRDEVKRKLEAHTRQHTTAEQMEWFVEHDVLAAEVNDYEDMAVDPQVQQNDMIVDVDHPEIGSYKATGIPVEFSKTPGEIESPPPGLGEHTDDVLAELGYDEQDIERLASDDVVKRGAD